MSESTTNVTNLDIQMLNANHSAATTVKLDNPKDNITREQVSAAMQPAFTNGWFLCNDGSTAMYLGDVTINQSIKTRLDGEDFYVTPSTLTFSGRDIQSSDITVSGATIQGYNITSDNEIVREGFNVSLSENKLVATVKAEQYMLNNLTAGTYNLQIVLIILGTEVNIPVTLTIT